jgi:hypothetical protein
MHGEKFHMDKSSIVEYAEKEGYNDATVGELEDLEKKIVKEAQQAAFAKDMAVEIFGFVGQFCDD